MRPLEAAYFDPYVERDHQGRLTFVNRGLSGRRHRDRVYPILSAA